MTNPYVALTEEFNRDGCIAVLSSGQAVVYYRLAMVSKDGDWILRERPAACRTVLDVLAAHGARYRAGAPLDVAWLAGGWSSHFEFVDAVGMRIRCDFVSRPPRMTVAAVDSLFTRTSASGLPVIDLPSLVAIKQTQRAKDYPVIGALARLLPPAQELEFTTDPDRVIELAQVHGAASSREVVRLARQAAGRDAIVVAMARELDRLQQADRLRLDRYKAASAAYLEAFVREGIDAMPLPLAHARVLALAGALLPPTVG
jgi:hypothetical protein